MGTVALRENYNNTVIANIVTFLVLFDLFIF